MKYNMLENYTEDERFLVRERYCLRQGTTSPVVIVS